MEDGASNSGSWRNRFLKAAVAHGLLKGNSDAAQACEEDSAEKYTDLDLFALLCRDGMGGFGGMRWDEYGHTPDRVIRDSYFAEFDEDHRLIPYRERWRQVRATETGSLARAGRELPSREALNIPDEAYQVNPLISHTPFGQSYLLVFWQCWRRRQKEGVLDENGEPITDSYILKRWIDKANPGAPKQHDRQKRQSKAQPASRCVGTPTRGGKPQEHRRTVR